ncbi:MAG: phosphotyrosine protein phosphatase, partial [Blastocatellia bacterium]|nr:phosphotyrosine protein phosphatase [Blastocatellia bacterium]
CSQNRLRSPTAEQVFSTWEGIEVSSAGLDNDAKVVVTPDILRWADLIFVMEKPHRNKLSKKFRAHISGKRIICLNIPDEFSFMDSTLVSLLINQVVPYLERSQ